jgi:hypothetical protein
MSFKCATFGIRIVAYCVTLSIQVARKLKWAITLEFTTITAIIFTHCCGVVIIIRLVNLVGYIYY